MTNKSYQKLVHDLFVWLLKNDQVDNDLTTSSLFSKNKIVNSQIITRQNITAAGLEEIDYLVKTFTKLKIKHEIQDGDNIKKGGVLVEIKGEVKEILSYERVIINVLQRLSGIATQTKNLVKQINSDKPSVAATRKTQWGLLDKKAVAMGGGLTHRLSLSDGILVKDNHLMFLSAKETLIHLLKTVKQTLIEIEVEDEKSLKQLVQLFEETKTDNALGILLDNFTPEQAKKILSKMNQHPNIVFEASGGITKENISAWARTGVDIISSGALTHSSKAADLSLEIKA